MMINDDLDPRERDEDNASGVSRAAPQGRRRPRRRASRHSFAAETVINNLEDFRFYRAFERTIITSISPRSGIELEIAHGLVNLLWRLRRARMIETGHLEVQAECLITSASARESNHPQSSRVAARPNGSTKVDTANGADCVAIGKSSIAASPEGRLPRPFPNARAIAQCFLRLSNFDQSFLERVGAYEVRLWRQAVQTIWTLDAMRHPPTAPVRPRFRKPAPHHLWHWER
jgi:hypothetical protein